MHFYVYALVDPRDNTIRYVGYTSSPRYRLQVHRNGKSGKTHKGAWINNLRKDSLLPRMEILGKYKEEKEAHLWESSWISVLRDTGCRLTNHGDGGESSVRGLNWTLSEESRKKISEGRKLYYQRMREAGVIPTSPFKGKKHTEESRRKISEARTGSAGHPHTEEFKAQVAERNRTRVWTEESRRKASESAKRRHQRERRLSAGEE